MTQDLYTTRKKIWKIITPLFPFLRTKFGFLRYLRYIGRETYPIGFSPLPFSIIENELEKAGFVKYYVAWLDQGEVLSMRKSDGFEWQYHIRIFNDGEVRGHYELTPEYQAFKHFFDFGKVARSNEFHEMIGHLLEPHSCTYNIK